MPPSWFLVMIESTEWKEWILRTARPMSTVQIGYGTVGVRWTWKLSTIQLFDVCSPYVWMCCPIPVNSYSTYTVAPFIQWQKRRWNKHVIINTYDTFLILYLRIFIYLSFFGCVCVLLTFTIIHISIHTLSHSLSHIFSLLVQNSSHIFFSSHRIIFKSPDLIWQLWFRLDGFLIAKLYSSLIAMTTQLNDTSCANITPIIICNEPKWQCECVLMCAYGMCEGEMCMLHTYIYTLREHIPWIESIDLVLLTRPTKYPFI